MVHEPVLILKALHMGYTNLNDDSIETPPDT